MKLKCHRQALLRRVTTPASIAPSKSPRPALADLKLVASPSHAIALASDLELSVTARLDEVIVEETGEVLIPAQTLIHILRSIEADEVVIASDGRHCEIRSSDAFYRLVTQDPAEFPAIEPAVDGGGVVIQRALLEEMMSRTSFAVARDIGRYAIHGIMVEALDEDLRFVATDGRRLAISTRNRLPAAVPRVRAIVPPKAIQELLRGSEGSPTVRMHLEETRVVLSTDHLDISAKTIIGDFPDYEGVVPSDRGALVRVNSEAFQGAVRKVSILAADEMRTVQIRVAEGSLSIAAQTEGRGKANAEIEARLDSGKPFSIEFNPDFLLDFLKSLPPQDVSFEFIGENRPGILRPEIGDDTYVVMPITAS